jgi:anaerobic dimethyl sulfoxide reductase subunit B (iron-sulfur subunit)
VRQVAAVLFEIDIARCTGCYACSIACKDRAGLPDEVDWLHVETHEGGAYPYPTLYYWVVHCFHCTEPPCASACPTGAIGRDGRGWVQIDAQLCIACGACAEACPFHAVALGPDGLALKCDACADETAREWEPTCVRACPTRALDYVSADQGLPDNRIVDPEFDDHDIGPAVRYLRRAQQP